MDVDVAVVLQDCVDQLAILGASDSSFSPFAEDKQLLAPSSDDITAIVQHQRRLELQYDQLLQSRSAAMERNEDDEEILAKLREVVKQLKQSTELLCDKLRQDSSASSQAMRIHTERKVAMGALEDALSSSAAGSARFQELDQLIRKYVAEGQEFTNAVQTEKEEKARLKALKARLRELGELKETEVAKQNELIAQLKDQRQEEQVRTKLESSFVQRDAAVQLSRFEKETRTLSKELQAKVATIKQQLEEEQQVHDETMSFLKASQTKLTQQLEEWMERFEAEVDQKQQEVDQTALDRNHTLTKLQDLTEQYKEYEAVCQKEREKKRKEKADAELAIKQLAAAIRVQAWWRGAMVRNKLGPYKSGGKSGKGGKKKKKGGKKKKK